MFFIILNASTATLYLADCTLSGSLPTQLGLLTNLGKNILREPSRVARQQTFASHSDLLETFNACYRLALKEILHLGRNNLNGKIPTEIGLLANLGKAARGNVV